MIVILENSLDPDEMLHSDTFHLSQSTYILVLITV